ncbi:NAD(P)/FAD-dependent oxidoreductase [Zhouia sp. PK063]|uniref:NAD(P)/FAD-dependent oxidoreductase n=1 Tax=Zhouia sp. PK063 TaxID=3373602 RepID=UPI0037AEEBBE
MTKDVVIVGGGAAGFFAAIQLAKLKPQLSIAILEKSKEVLSKVKISGGGRCNVTHAEFIPNELTKYYPRGERELKGPFHTFCSGDTMAFFEERGVALKIEEDGRIFPESDSSQSIIDCFLNETKKHGISIHTQCGVSEILKEDKCWLIKTTKENFIAKQVLVATGSSPKVWTMLEQLQHTIIQPVPSLFTFNIKDNRIKDLAGLSTLSTIKVIGESLQAEGPTLITHWGLSGPGILRLSAWGARILNTLNYQFEIEVNWLYQKNPDEALAILQEEKIKSSKKLIFNTKPFDLPKRLWHSLLVAAKVTSELKWSDINKKQLQDLSFQLTKCVFNVNGKSTFKEEFVTAGGIDLKEINFKTYESKLHHNLYFAGEVLNIDAITGGFNFQNAWTSGYIAAQAMAASK